MTWNKNIDKFRRVAPELRTALQLCQTMCLKISITRAGHRKFKLNSATAISAKLQEVFRNRKSASLR